MKSALLIENEFIELIRNGPLVSIDLIVKNTRGEILLGFRKNAPAKNWWFVPGGRVRKNEKLDDAFKRITLNEINQETDRRDARLLNIYEHFYESENKFDVKGLDTHYIVIAYVLDLSQDIHLFENEQHTKFKWMKIGEILNNRDVHQHTKNYFMTVQNSDETKIR